VYLREDGNYDWEALKTDIDNGSFLDKVSTLDFDITPSGALSEGLCGYRHWLG
jgi:hypothetical protein